jgi:hypothetical protein
VSELYDPPELERLAIPTAEGLDVMLAAFGGGVCPLELHANDLEFVEKYGLTIDGVPFDLRHKYKHLRDFYADDHDTLVAMAGAQTGKTGRLLVKLGRDLARHWGSLFGYYFPDKHLPAAFSRERFKPFMQSNPDLGQYLGAPRTSGKGVDGTMTRSFGESTLYFMTTAGVSATEGLPLKGVYFDEVRRMDMGDIERAQERYSAQVNPIDVKVSTARYPESDIHKFFLEGDQRFFHSDCSCPNGCVLSQVYPNCILDLRRATPKLLRKVQHAFSHAGLPYLGMNELDRARYPEAVYFCPTCGDVIVDPREGWWEAHSTGWAHSYQMPQLLSPTYPAGRVLDKHEKARDIQEFWNSCIGIPFLDEEKRPVRLEHLLACVNTELRWPARMPAEWRRQYLSNTAMGVDVQAGYLVAVIKAVAPNGKYRTIHLEVVHGKHASDPWHSLGRLMHEYDVRLAVIDQAPEWSAALRFAQAFKGRVFLANYTSNENSTAMVSWGDVTKDKKQRGKETKFKYRVNIERVKGLKWSLGRWVVRQNEIPDPTKLVQRLPKQKDRVVLSPELRIGRKAPVAIAREVYFDHLQRIMFRDAFEDQKGPQRELRAKRGEKKIVAEYVGYDPHFAHADLYASVALARIGVPARPRRV